MTKIIEDQKMHLINFKPEIELPEIALALSLRESTYEKLDQLLTGSCNLATESLHFDE